MSTGLFADARGALAGQFTVPPGVPVGTKRVVVSGSGGSRGEALFTGQGVIETELRGRVQTITEFHIDPLAQTFTLAAARYAAGVDLIFTTLGDVNNPVTVQIRETAVGFPTGVVLAEALVDMAGVGTGGWTRVEWPLRRLEANTEYALVILTDDPDHAVAVAEMGKYDARAGRWITSQPYRIGVLLSSSNASTWTAHQTHDLCFRLLGAAFAATTREVTLGTVTAAQASDIIALANVERPETETDIQIVLTDGAGNSATVGAEQPVALSQRWDGDVTVRARLTGTPTATPILYPGLQAVFGILQDTATYVSREIETPSASRLTVIYEALTPGNATVTVDAQDDTDGWVPVPVSGGTPVGDGWREMTCALTPYTASDTRVRLTLSGSVAWRPRVRNLRVVAT